MKIKYLSLGMMLLAASALALMAGCVVEPGRVVVRGPEIVAPAPAVVVAPAPPPPPPPVVVEVPDYYVWDGVEFVGFVGDTCFYLGPGERWVVCEPFRVARFHEWERVHVDWRVHMAVRNDRYRTDRFGHTVPRREIQDERRDDHRQDRRQDRREDHRDDHH